MVTALMLAAKLGSNSAALAMLESGADVILKVRHTLTLLHRYMVRTDQVQVGVVGLLHYVVRPQRYNTASKPTPAHHVRSIIPTIPHYPPLSHANSTATHQTHQTPPLYLGRAHRPP